MGASLARRLKFEGVYEVAASGFVVGIIVASNFLLVGNLFGLGSMCSHGDHRGNSSFLASFVYVQPSSISKSLFWDAPLSSDPFFIGLLSN